MYNVKQLQAIFNINAMETPSQGVVYIEWNQSKLSEGGESILSILAF